MEMKKWKDRREFIDKGREFKEYLDDLREWSRDVCKRLGLAPVFIYSLKDEDDWSFVIKANALIEAALTHALVKKLGGVEELQGNKLLKVFIKMPQYQRIQWAVGLGLLGEDEKRWMVVLNNVRNDVVHDVTNVDLDVTTYFEKRLKDGDWQSFVSICSLVMSNITKDQVDTWWRRYPKTLIWIILHSVMESLYDFLPSKLDMASLSDGAEAGDEVSAEIVTVTDETEPPSA